MNTLTLKLYMCRFGKRSYLHNLDTWADVLHPPRHLREDYMVSHLHLPGLVFDGLI